MFVLRLIQFQSADVADTAADDATAAAANPADDAGDAKASSTLTNLACLSDIIAGRPLKRQEPTVSHKSIILCGE